MKQPRYMSVVSAIYFTGEEVIEVHLEDRFAIESLIAIMMNFMVMVLKSMQRVPMI